MPYNVINLIVDTGFIENDIGTKMWLNKYKFKLKFIF